MGVTRHVFSSINTGNNSCSNVDTLSLSLNLRVSSPFKILKHFNFIYSLLFMGRITFSFSNSHTLQSDKDIGNDSPTVFLSLSLSHSLLLIGIESDRVEWRNMKTEKERKSCYRSRIPSPRNWGEWEWLEASPSNILKHFERVAEKWIHHLSPHIQTSISTCSDHVVRRDEGGRMRECEGGDWFLEEMGWSWREVKREVLSENTALREE